MLLSFPNCRERERPLLAASAAGWSEPEHFRAKPVPNLEAFPTTTIANFTDQDLSHHFATGAPFDPVAVTDTVLQPRPSTCAPSPAT